MKNNARDLIYLDTNRYMSLSNLRSFYFGIIIIPFMMVVMGIAAICTKGAGGKTLFPIVSVVVWSLLYWAFVTIIQNRRTKKTFELRFVVNGITGVLISVLFWLLFSSFNLVADSPVVEFDFCLWLLFFYLLFSVVYIGLIVIGVHKGAYRKIRKKGEAPKYIAFSALCATLISGAGVIGMHISRLLRSYTSVDVQNIGATIAFVMVIFLPALAHINFVQYYYCKKYKILCDENGNTTSPLLERQIKVKK